MRPGFASTGFPVSFAALVCSCRAAGWGGRQGGRGLHGEDEMGWEQNPGWCPPFGVLGGSQGKSGGARRAGGGQNLCTKEPELGLGGWDGKCWGQGARGWLCPGSWGQLGAGGREQGGLRSTCVCQKTWPKPRAISCWLGAGANKRLGWHGHASESSVLQDGTRQGWGDPKTQPPSPGASIPTQQPPVGALSWPHPTRGVFTQYILFFSHFCADSAPGAVVPILLGAEGAAGSQPFF